MKFEEDKSAEKFGVKIGYILAYFLFTTILFYILKFSHKLPGSWSYFHVMGITLLVVLVGLGIARLLK